MAGVLYKVKTVADHFQVTHKTICNWIRTGQLDAVRIAGQFRIPEEAVQKIMRPARGKK